MLPAQRRLNAGGRRRCAWRQSISATETGSGGIGACGCAAPGALQDGGPTSFFELWRTLPPERLARAEDEAEARRRAEASFITHLQAIAHGRTGLSVSALRQPMPSDPARAADDEAVLRMLWLWVGYVAYDETLSESGEEAVKRFLKRAWPKYHGSRITRSLLETWVQYAKDIKYERDAQACYGGRGWDPRRRR